MKEIQTAEPTAERPSLTASEAVSPTPTARPTPTAEPLGFAPRVTLTILYDNNVDDRRLETAWGFACLVQGLDTTILFDTGGDQRLMRNMDALGIDPRIVDVVVLSHAHGDHVGGLRYLLNENNVVTVYVPASFPSSTKRTVTEAGARLVEVRDPVEVCDHARTTGVLGDGIDEQALIVETAQGAAVITGCAHPGITRIVQRAQELVGDDIHLVMGGFHLGGSSEAAIAHIVEQFQALGVERAAPCHCSGNAARRHFESAYGSDYIPAGVGTVIEIGVHSDRGSVRAADSASPAPDSDGRQPR